jgi:DNA-binding HxlR family transcriptional regulator
MDRRGWLVNSTGRRNSYGSFKGIVMDGRDALERKWSVSVLAALLSGTDQFRAMARTIDGISDKLLSQRLVDFESAGIVERIVYPTRPISVEYRLTEKGRALHEIVKSIQAWTSTWDSTTENRATG